MTQAAEDFQDFEEVLDEVDTPEEVEETDEVEEDEKPKKKAAKKAVKKAAARPPVPEGYIAPVAFAKVLTKELIERGLIAADEEIPPQMVYSYIKNTATTRYPLPNYEEGGRVNLLKEDEALEWWLAKIERAKERAASAKKKKEKKVVEETEDDASEVEEAE